MQKIQKIMVFLNILMVAVFLPVLCCVVFIGNGMEYNEGLKLKTLIANPVLFIVAVCGIAVCVALIWCCRKMELTQKRNWVVNAILAALFLVLYFVNVWVAREIAFMLPWDIMVVRGVGYEIAKERALGNYYYLSIYSNNIPISYILGKLYRFAADMGNYPYVFDFIWIQVSCVFVSVAGFFSCLTVKKLTKNVMAVAITFLLYLALAGISPWKIAPYTDTYGMLFPVMSVYFYVSYRQAKTTGGKCVSLVLALAGLGIGSFIKPSIYLILIAVLGVELLFLLENRGKGWKYLVFGLLLTAVIFCISGNAKEAMIEKIGLDYNKELEAGWQHYFHMGLNEETTGSWCSDDNFIFAEYQTSKAERNQVAFELALERLKEKGFPGTLYFYLRKMVMTFNDGSFGWETEVWIDSFYPPNLAGNTAMTEWLRNVFWVNSLYTGRYNTFCQLVWIFCILGIPGICLCKREQVGNFIILTVAFLGIFFYQMLFEARARYLFTFLPLLISVSVCGMQQYVFKAEAFRQRRGTKGQKTADEAQLQEEV